MTEINFNKKEFLTPNPETESKTDSVEHNSVDVAEAAFDLENPRDGSFVQALKRLAGE